MTHITQTPSLLEAICSTIKQITARKQPAIVFSNVADGTHSGNITRILENTFTSSHLLAKQGTSANLVDVCSALDLPIGTITDEGAASDAVNLALLGSASSTLTMVASEAISAGTHVYAAAAGKVSTLPVAAGTYYRVGVALTDATGDGATLEVDPYAPSTVTV